MYLCGWEYLAKLIMQKKLKYILKKKLTVKGVPLDAEKIQIINQFFSSLHNVSIVYRCVDSDYLQNQYNTSVDNIGLLSEYIFLYGVKGKLFYDKLDQKTMNLEIDELTNASLAYIYNKFQKIFVSQRIESEKTKEAVSKFKLSNPGFIGYWEKLSIEEWLSLIEKLDNQGKQQVKDYYIAILHTIGLAGYGRNSYFLSTSRRSDIGEFLHIPNDGIEIVGWSKVGSKNVYTPKRFDRNAETVERLGFPVIKSDIFPEQEEITYKCGLLPHFIIGFFYDDAFEVNPYIFESDSFLNVSQEGLPVCQAPFYERLKELNYRSTYIEIDDMLFQISLNQI